MYYLFQKQANSKARNTIDVEAIMNVWIQQAGYPLVSVKRLGGNWFELTQERFLLGMRQDNSSNHPNELVFLLLISYPHNIV